MRTALAALAAVVAVLVLGPVIAWDSDAEVVQDDLVYCYGDDPVIVPVIGTADDDTWTVTSGGEPFDGWEWTGETDGSIVLHLEGHDETVVVTQTVGDQQAIIEVIPLHLPLHDEDADDQHIVTFHDGDRIAGSHRIGRTTVISYGDDHVLLPDDPVKQGYVFEGWYTDPGFSDGSEFDPSRPVYGNVEVYAKWSAAPTSGDTVITVPGGIVTTHTVTFYTDAGLEYTIVDSGASFVSFTVGVVGGFVLDGDIEVTSSGGTLTESDGTYTIYGISTDISVRISGDARDVDQPVTVEEHGFPWWILIVIVILLVVIAILAYELRRRSSRGDESQDVAENE